MIERVQNSVTEQERRGFSEIEDLIDLENAHGLVRTSNVSTPGVLRVTAPFVLTSGTANFEGNRGERRNEDVEKDEGPFHMNTASLNESGIQRYDDDRTRAFQSVPLGQTPEEIEGGDSGFPTGTEKSPVLFYEEGSLEKDDESMQNYTKTMLDSTNENVAYCTASLPGNPKVEEFLKGLDVAFCPIRSGGDRLFREGVRKKRTSKHLLIHHPNKLSHAYLQSHLEGVLHVLPGWDRASFVSDISYRFKSKHTQENSRVPFLGGLPCEVRTYHCLGVMVCKRCSPEFRNARHIVVNPRDKNILEALGAVDYEAEAKKKAIGIYKDVKSRLRFCSAPVRVPGRNVFFCTGKARIVRSRRSTAKTKYFLGCTKYARCERGHYARGLELEDDMIEFLEKLLSGAEAIPAALEGDYNIVQPKNKGKKCPKHGCEMVHVPCKSRVDDKDSSHVMCTYEPAGYNSEIEREKIVLYLSCKGKHTHPPPPPPDTTVTKMCLFEEICAKKSFTSMAHLRNAIQNAFVLLRDGSPKDGIIRLFNGSLELPVASLRRRLKRIQPPVPKLAVEIGLLGIMASNPEMPDVRSFQMVGEKCAVILGLDELLEFACGRLAFAGDATYKTVTEACRKLLHGRWYLYNIVVAASRDRMNGKGIVVLRALITGLWKDVYCTIWSYFFKSLIKAWNKSNGNEVVEQGCLAVPYLQVPPTLASRTCSVSSITMDFDSAEIHGCAEALRGVCGGSIDMHLQHMFIGCKVHLDRDLRRRADRADKQQASGMSKLDIFATYWKIAAAENVEEAETALEKIKTFDPEWINWVEREGMGPLISKGLSRMSSHARTIGFAYTNVVDSQNRRGNHIAGTHLDPCDAVKRLHQLDLVDLETLKKDGFNTVERNRGTRRRNDSTLRPSSSSTPSVSRKRSKSGGGPAQKRSKSVTRKPHMATNKSSGDGRISPIASSETAHDERHETSLVSARAQVMLSALEGDLDTLDGGESNLEQRETRMDLLIDILNDVHDVHVAGEDAGKVKTILLDGLKKAKGNMSFRKRLFQVFNACLHTHRGDDHGGAAGDKGEGRGDAQNGNASSK